MSAYVLPGFKPATADEVKRHCTRTFDPVRFYAQEGGQVVGYCVLEPEQRRISYPWCKKGFESRRASIPGSSTVRAPIAG